MRNAYLVIFCLASGLVLAGCSGVKTYTYEEKRVDQDLRRGNRGVIMGDVPADEPDRKSTRTMMGVDVTLPADKEYKAKKEALKEEMDREPEPVVTLTLPPMPPGAPAEAPVERKVEKKYVPPVPIGPKTYTVQKGDTLQEISMKFYGTTKEWPAIFEANKDTIKHSSKIYPGQVIIIPPQESAMEKSSEMDYK